MTPTTHEVIHLYAGLPEAMQQVIQCRCGRTFTTADQAHDHAHAAKAEGRAV